RHAPGLSQPLDPGGEAPFAQRIDPEREPGLSPQQRLLMAQVERAQRQRALQRRLRGRNALVALGIGAVVLGICILRGRGRGGVGGDAPRTRLLFSLTHPPQMATPSTRCRRNGSWTIWSRRRRRRGPGPGRGPRVQRAEGSARPR
uniref:Uncharacterized protein n=1 Tax=Falco tinnunculus TaxID=100819 RepID=A0A8C4TTH4_FALTI